MKNLRMICLLIRTEYMRYDCLWMNHRLNTAKLELYEEKSQKEDAVMGLEYIQWKHWCIVLPPISHFPSWGKKDLRDRPAWTTIAQLHLTLLWWKCVEQLAKDFLCSSLPSTLEPTTVPTNQQTSSTPPSPTKQKKGVMWDCWSVTTVQYWTPELHPRWTWD